MGNLRAGVSKIDVTPPVGIPLAYAKRYMPSQGIHDPLYAKALALTNVHKAVILITADVLSVSKKNVERVREGVQTWTGVDPESVMIAATHTHSAPATIGIGADPGDPRIEAYLSILEKHLTGVACMAWRNMTDAMIGSGKG